MILYSKNRLELVSFIVMNVLFMLGACLTVLKAMGIISWSWARATFPLWGTYLIYCLIIVVDIVIDFILFCKNINKS